MSDRESKRDLLLRLGSLQGEHRITICKHRRRRTDAQNRYYHGCIVRSFHDFLQEQGETYTHDEVHQILAAKFLRVGVPDPRTGEQIAERVRSTTTLNIVEFGNYIESCIAWLADMFGIACPDPQIYAGVV
jgi:hypothetical protein